MSVSSSMFNRVFRLKSNGLASVPILKVWPCLFRLLLGGILLFVGISNVMCVIQNSQMLGISDPILGIPFRVIFFAVGLIELALAWLCLFTEKKNFVLWFSGWLVLNFFVYRIGLWTMGWHHPYGWVQGLMNSLNTSPFKADIASFAATGLLILGGCATLICRRFEKFETKESKTPQPVATKPGRIERSQEAFVRTLKISCTACGGHIEFPTNFFGERISCPHCQASIVLQKARNLKMSCTACEGHIEFPDHAIGQKIKCPHCENDITLKEPV